MNIQLLWLERREFWGAIKGTAMADPTDTENNVQPACPPPGMRALLDEYRRKHSAFRTGPAPGSEARQESKHPFMDALLEDYRYKGFLKGR